LAIAINLQISLPPSPDKRRKLFGQISDTNGKRANKRVLRVRRIPAAGGAEQNLPEFTHAGFTGSWTVTAAGIYFIARHSDQSLKIKFYDFADGKIKNISGERGIPENIYGNLAATADGSSFLYALLDQNASSIMLAEIDK